MKRKKFFYTSVVFVAGCIIGIRVHFTEIRDKMITKEKQIEEVYTLNEKSLKNIISELTKLSNVKEEYVEELKNIYLKLIQKEYLEGKGKELLENAFDIVYKSNPNIKSLLFLDIQDKISENREVFFENKKELDNKILDYNYYIDKHNIVSTIYNRNRIKEENKDKNI